MATITLPLSDPSWAGGDIAIAAAVDVTRRHGGGDAAAARSFTVLLGTLAAMGVIAAREQARRDAGADRGVSVARG